MALRKFLFQNSTEGFSEEQAATDELALGKVTFSGVSGVAIDAGGQLISNVATPVAASDVAIKGYVDSLAAGLDIKASVRLATAAALPAVTAAGTGVGKTLTADANGALTVDGVAAAAGNRILVKNQTAADDNGIYVVTDAGSAGTPFVLTRSTDADQDAEVTAGMFMFVAEGTVNADTGWVLVTNDTIVVDTTNLTFSQFSSVVGYTFDQGLSNTSGSIKVELDTDADAQGAGAGGGSSGLEFDANTSAGQLRAAVHATGGLERTGTGLAVKIDDSPDTLDSGANGLKVTGLPSLFKVNGTAVGATVTAPNLDTLTNGSNADALHIHTAAAATEAPKVENTIPVNEAIAVSDPVYITSTAGRVGKGDTTDAKAKIIGIARTAQAVVGNNAEIVTSGPAAGTLSGATSGVPYYLATGGGISTSLPASGQRVIQVGIALNATDLFTRIVDYGKKAA